MNPFNHGIAQPALGDWPVRAANSAFDGVLGEFVLRIEPHTEADPHSILIQALVMLGNIVGRNVYFKIDQTHHHPNIFAAIVGQTSSARKGMARDLAKAMMFNVDPFWPGITAGLQSGEGLIHAVRDPSLRQSDSRATRDRTSKQVPDPGVSDKRLMVIEPEFGAVLQIIKRPGNILSAVLRQAWDGDTLQVASRNTAAKATGSHISVIGHITLDELLQLFDDVSIYNGLGNRILWVAARRTRSLPEGGTIPTGQFVELGKIIRRAVIESRSIGQMDKSPRARRIWEQEYDRLTGDRTGIVGAITARAAPYVLRLATCYAVLDQSRQIKSSHLRSALALWDYCEASAKYIFGARVGQRDADRLLRALRIKRDEGLTRSQIFSEVFQRHRDRSDIERALSTLVTERFARCQRTKTSGRPEERWFAL